MLCRGKMANSGRELDEIIKKANSLNVGKETEWTETRSSNQAKETDEEEWEGGTNEGIDVFKECSVVGRVVAKKHYTKKFLQTVFGRI